MSKQKLILHRIKSIGHETVYHVTSECSKQKKIKSKHDGELCKELKIVYVY